MPIYEYSCRKCGAGFSRSMSVADHEKRRVSCPKCKSKSVERVYSSLQVVTSKKS